MSLISCTNMTKEYLDSFINNTAKLIRENDERNKLTISEPIIDLNKNKKILINAFFEPSTRTSLSFENAMIRLGGKVINYNYDNSSQIKGETIEDTIKTLCIYGDIIVLRHPDKDVIYKAAEICKKHNVRLINGGNGSDEHPTQALTDLFTVYWYLGNTPINILFTGDILYSRTIHSFIKLLGKYKNIRVSFLPFPNRHPSEEMLDEWSKLFDQNKENMIYHTKDDVDFKNINVIYATRFQREREECLGFVENIMIKDFQINLEFVNKFEKKPIIMHPFPRNNELSEELDYMKNSAYLNQMKLGIFTRMSLLKEFM